jgi:spoIIIJ-associated protein
VEGKKYTVASTGPKIEAFLTQIKKRAGFDFRFAVGEAENLHPDFENPDIVVRFGGEDVALEQLTMEMLRMTPDEHSLLQFDANDYRALRIEELRMSALTAAERVKKTKAPFEFSPMTSRERRIIHLALRGEPEVRSESTGIGSHRQVVIYPAGMPALPPKPVPPRRPPGRRR